jgi:hypothetical protein
VETVVHELAYDLYTKMCFSPSAADMCHDTVARLMADPVQLGTSLYLVDYIADPTYRIQTACAYVEGPLLAGPHTGLVRLRGTVRRPPAACHAPASFSLHRKVSLRGAFVRARRAFTGAHHRVSGAGQVKAWGFLTEELLRLGVNDLLLVNDTHRADPGHTFALDVLNWTAEARGSLTLAAAAQGNVSDWCAAGPRRGTTRARPIADAGRPVGARAPATRAAPRTSSG